MFGMGAKLPSRLYRRYRGRIASRMMSSTANLMNSARLSRRRWLSARTSASRRPMAATSNPRALRAPALSSAPQVREPPLDVRNFQRAQLVLDIEVLRDVGLDLLADR